VARVKRGASLLAALVAGASFVVSSPGAGKPSWGALPFDPTGWRTDFSRHSVPLAEIVPGGPPKDGIPALDHPTFEDVARASRWLRPREPVILVERDGDAKVYPLQILIWHEIVNDAVGGVPVAVTFCPLCHTAIAYERRVGGQLLDFGTTGNLRFSDLVMYDRQTESWWQQATGEAIVGALTGARLSPVPAQIVAWSTVLDRLPRAQVLSRRTGYQRPYGHNPYVGYDDATASPFLYRGPRDARLPPMERVVAVSLGGEDVAYPFSLLEAVRVVNDAVGGTPLVVMYQKGVASALDRGSIAASRDVGTAAVFARSVRGRVLTFALRGDQVVDTRTHSTWTILGEAISGPLRGARLAPVPAGQPFWFAWAAFKPRTRIFHR